MHSYVCLYINIGFVFLAAFVYIESLPNVTMESIYGHSTNNITIQNLYKQLRGMYGCTMRIVIKHFLHHILKPCIFH